VKSTQLVEQDQALVRCGRQVTLGATGGWCVVLDCCTVHLELAAGLSGAAYVHSLQFHRITELQNGRGWKGPLWII